jgi:histone deacetylase 1/2
MINAKPVKTPMAPALKLLSDGTDEVSDPTLYRSVVGALQYTTITRPDLSYTVNKLCQFMQKPLHSHWKAVKRTLRYIFGTLDYGLHYKPSSCNTITGFNDSDWASDPSDMRSTTGFSLFLGKNLVSWLAKKQKVVSRSSTEAEFQSLASLAAEISYLQNLLIELHSSSSSTTATIWCDNSSAVLLTANLVLHSRTKHFEVDL